MVKKIMIKIMRALRFPIPKKSAKNGRNKPRQGLPEGIAEIFPG